MPVVSIALYLLSTLLLGLKLLGSKVDDSEHALSSGRCESACAVLSQQGPREDYGRRSNETNTDRVQEENENVRISRYISELEELYIAGTGKTYDKFTKGNGFWFAAEPEQKAENEDFWADNCLVDDSNDSANPSNYINLLCSSYCPECFHKSKNHSEDCSIGIENQISLAEESIKSISVATSKVKIFSLEKECTRWFNKSNDNQESDAQFVRNYKLKRRQRYREALLSGLRCPEISKAKQGK